MCGKSQQQNKQLHAVIVLSLCTSRFITSTLGWDLVGFSRDIDVIETNTTINMPDVLFVSSASSVTGCLANANEVTALSLSIRSFYFDKSSRMCYYKNSYDDVIPSDTLMGARYYCKVSKSYHSYRKEDIPNDLRVTVTDSIYSSCQDIYDINGFQHYGVNYAKDPLNLLTFTFVPCDEGWTMFQRRYDGSVDFYRNWDDYVNGFGNESGEFWLGLETIHQLTSQGNCELYVYLKAKDNNPKLPVGYARYSHFEVEGLATNYTLRVSGYCGNVGDSLGNHSGYQFSTFDIDNDVSSAHCAQKYRGAWWYRSCHHANLNGLYLYGAHSSYADGIEWHDTWGYYYSLIHVEMRLKCN